MGKMVDSDKLRVLRKMASNTEDMLNKDGLEKLKTIQQYAGRGEITPSSKSLAETGMKALGEASDDVADKVAAKVMGESAEVAKKGASKIMKNLPKAAGLAAGPIGLLASGAAEAFDAEALGDENTGISYDQRKELPEEVRRNIIPTSSEDTSDKKRIAQRILNKTRDRNARREAFLNSDLSPELQQMVDETKEAEIMAEYNKDSGLRRALESAANESQTPEMKEKYLRMLRRRGMR